MARKSLLEKKDIAIMNKFQKEIQNRNRKVLKIIGLGTVPYSLFIRWIRVKLKQDIKEGKIKFN
jgi:hypothetical protein